MRRTLTVVLVAIALAVVVVPVRAGEINWSAGVTLTEKEAGVQIGSRIEAYNGRRLVGSWFSSSGQLPVMVQGLEYDAFGDFPAIRNIQKVVLSPDHGLTEWQAEQIEGKGYRVVIPHLPAGSYGLEWGVRSRDKHNRLMLIIIPINWTSHRSTGSTNHAMVQRPPLGSENFSDQEWFACLRSFVSAWASLDPAFVAQQQMMGQQAPVQPQPTVQPQPGVMTSPHHRLEAEPPQPPSAMPSIPSPEPNFGPGAVSIVLDGGRKGEVTLNASYPFRMDIGDVLIFRRQGKFVAESRVTNVIPGRLIEGQVVRGGKVYRGDEISKGGK